MSFECYAELEGLKFGINRIAGSQFFARFGYDALTPSVDMPSQRGFRYRIITRNEILLNLVCITFSSLFNYRLQSKAFDSLIFQKIFHKTAIFPYETRKRMRHD